MDNILGGETTIQAISSFLCDEIQSTVGESSGKMEAHKPSEHGVNPMTTANIFSYITLWWMNPTLKRGYRQSLEAEDLHHVRPGDEAGFLTDKLERLWHNATGKCRLIKALGRFVRFDLFFGFSLLGLETSLRVVPALLVGQLVGYFTPGSTMTLNEAIMWAGLLTLCMFVKAQLNVHGYLLVLLLSMKVRVATCGLIYRKALKLSPASLANTPVGTVINHMSNDVIAFDMWLKYVPCIPVVPVPIILVLYILARQMGPVAPLGFIVYILIIPLHILMSRVFIKLRLKVAAIIDRRLHTTEEVISGIRAVKMNCWENMLYQKVRNIRSHQLLFMWKNFKALCATLAPLMFAGQIWVILTVVGTIYLSHQPVPTSFLFTVMLMSHEMDRLWSFDLPTTIHLISVVYASILRIQAFLLLDEKTSNSITYQNGNGSSNGHSAHAYISTSLKEGDSYEVKLIPRNSDEEDVDISMVNASTQWPANGQASSPGITNISLKITRGELIAIIGRIGTGKSSFLLSIIGECPLTSGDLTTKGRFAYVPQNPWLFKATIRQNILFGQKFIEEKYQRVVKCCALIKDFDLFPYGDLSLVGDKGVTLSGGQKARISLARAVYRDADIYLLDDPLSAVDTTTGNHLFYKCITDHLKNKTVLLVTHQLQYLKDVNKILIMSKSTVSKLGVEAQNYNTILGNYEELNSAGTDLSVHLNPKKDDQSQLINDSEASAHQLMNGGLMFKSLSFGGLVHSRKDPASRSSKSLKKNSFQQQDEKQQDYNGLNSAVDIFSQSGSEAEPLLKNVDEKEKKEHRSYGRISGAMFKGYIQAVGGVRWCLLLLLVYLATQTSYVLIDWFLSRLAFKEVQYIAHEHSIITPEQSDFNLSSGNHLFDIAQERQNKLTLVMGFLVSLIIFAILRALLFFRMVLRGSKFLHNRMLRSVIRAQMIFHDTNPAGRVMNRFSKDLGIVDDIFPTKLFEVFFVLAGVIFVLVLNCVLIPWFIPFTFPLLVALFFLWRYYAVTSREVKRLEGVAISPVYNHLSATMAGLHTVRSSCAELILKEEFSRHQNRHTSAYFTYLLAGKWLDYRLDLTSVIYVIIMVSCILIVNEVVGVINSGIAGLAISYSVMLINRFHWLVRESGDLENYMTSVERVLEYCNEIDPEASLVEENLECKVSDWPTDGAVEIQNISLRYSETGPLVLKNINLMVKPAEKIGVVGRTGAGKSSLLAMLFRMYEPTGEIIIDRVNILKLGLHQLRSKISIIPQDPVLFSGSVRYNLDPSGRYSDDKIWSALQRVELYATIFSLSNKLDNLVDSGGGNFSAGQRQLLCLARAVLSKNRILVLDEATANVDYRTDVLIQKTIRRVFKDCTVITIAHRLNTVMDSDRIIVMGDGEIINQGAPQDILESSVIPEQR